MRSGTMIAPPPMPRKLEAEPAARPIAGTNRRWVVAPGSSMLVLVNGPVRPEAESRFQGGAAQPSVRN